MSEDFEELEQIPWAALATQPADPRGRWILIAVGAVVAVGAALWFLSAGGGEPAAVSMPMTTAEATTPSPAVAVTTPESVPPTVAVYSEADLMAINVSGEERLAVAQAEWLVRDLMTFDGDPQVAERVTALLPDRVDDDGTSSYVEWTKAFAVSSAETGHYRIEVLYRVLVGGEDGFTRQPAGAVAVELAVGVDGSSRLVAEPEAIAVPVLHGLDDTNR